MIWVIKMNWLRNFMYGRYGIDSLGNFLFCIYLILWILSFFFKELRIVSFIIIILCIYRMLSKQYYKRRRENDLYMQKTQRIRQWYHRRVNIYKYRHTHKYFKCPYCYQYLRVPKGKGEITITCPHCHQQFDRKT